MNLAQAQRLAVELMAQHGLTKTMEPLRIGMGAIAHAPVSPWRFEFDNARRRFGCCFYRHRLITLSKHLVALNDEAQVRDTILHEIAHAIAGPKAGHGPLWKAQAAAIGARPERCYSDENVITVTAKYQATCPTCGQEFKKFKQPKGTRYCGKCCRRYGYTEKARLTFHMVGRPMVVMPVAHAHTAPVPATQPAPAQLFFNNTPVGTVTKVTLTPPPVPVFNAAECVRLYNAGWRVVEIAVAMGYKRGTGQNRVTNALKAAGVYKGTRS
jgi:predicted SprT family Zn-dependent metalloprotease